MEAEAIFKFFFWQNSSRGSLKARNVHNTLFSFLSFLFFSFPISSSSLFFFLPRPAHASTSLRRTPSVAAAPRAQRPGGTAPVSAPLARALAPARQRWAPPRSSLRQRPGRSPLPRSDSSEAALSTADLWQAGACTTPLSGLRQPGAPAIVIWTGPDRWSDR